MRGGREFDVRRFGMTEEVVGRFRRGEYVVLLISQQRELGGKRRTRRSRRRGAGATTTAWQCGQRTCWPRNSELTPISLLQFPH